MPIDRDSKAASEHSTDLKPVWQTQKVIKWPYFSFWRNAFNSTSVVHKARTQFVSHLFKDQNNAFK